MRGREHLPPRASQAVPRADAGCPEQSRGGAATLPFPPEATDPPQAGEDVSPARASVAPHATASITRRTRAVRRRRTRSSEICFMRSVICSGEASGPSSLRIPLTLAAKSEYDWHPRQIPARVKRRHGRWQLAQRTQGHCRGTRTTRKVGGNRMAGCLPEQRVADTISLNLNDRQANLLHQSHRQQLVHPGYHRWPADAASPGDGAVAHPDRAVRPADLGRQSVEHEFGNRGQTPRRYRVHVGWSLAETRKRGSLGVSRFTGPVKILTGFVYRDFRWQRQTPFAGESPVCRSRGRCRPGRRWQCVDAPDERPGSVQAWPQKACGRPCRSAVLRVRQSRTYAALALVATPQAHGVSRRPRSGCCRAASPGAKPPCLSTFSACVVGHGPFLSSGLIRRLSVAIARAASATQDSSARQRNDAGADCFTVSPTLSLPGKC